MVSQHAWSYFKVSHAATDVLIRLIDEGVFLLARHVVSVIPTLDVGTPPKMAGFRHHVGVEK
ncbi:hypothetical protein HNQ34_003149 [Anoxybacillus tepidamans]|uniref:Uncharacterized protein n=1 Tax=Anoxybacteroides tepidamans TaxID=265948 RepID=A0A7W8ISV2_9BACL|nr:hypothetical protein [Anoxybacillus tepidamans]MBB5326031.1 hypothetical protein [Anoxybacillus tepidamans]